MHLDAWYAQSHPDEDFAETFAVWLTPQLGVGEALRRVAGAQEARIRGPADAEIAGRAPRSRRARTRRSARDALARRCASTTSSAARPLRRRRTRRSTTATCGASSPTARAPATPARPAFSDALPREVRRIVARWTGVYQYTIDQVLEDIIVRCRELKLRLAVPEDEAERTSPCCSTVQTMNYLHSGGHRVAL